MDLILWSVGGIAAIFLLYLAFIVLNVALGKNSLTNKAMHSQMKSQAERLANGYSAAYLKLKKESPDASDLEIIRAIQFDAEQLKNFSEETRRQIGIFCKTLNGICYAKAFAGIYDNLPVGRSIQFTFYVDRALEAIGFPKITKAQKVELLEIWGLTPEGWENWTPEGRDFPMKDDQEHNDQEYDVEDENENVMAKELCFSERREAAATDETFFRIRDQLHTDLSVSEVTITKRDLLVQLFQKSAEYMVRTLHQQLSFFNGRPLTSVENTFLHFETMVYLIFYADCYAFGAKQSENGRGYVSCIVEEFILQPAFYAEDKSLRKIVHERLATYLDRYHNGSPGTSDPWATFLNYVMLLSQDQRLARTEKIARADFVSHGVDWMLVGANPAFTLFVKCLGSLWRATKDISSLSARDMQNLMQKALRNAQPADLKVPSEKERTLVNANR